MSEEAKGTDPISEPCISDDDAVTKEEVLGDMVYLALDAIDAGVEEHELRAVLANVYAGQIGLERSPGTKHQWLPVGSSASAPQKRKRSDM